MLATVRSSRERLEEYLREAEFSGWDPFDGLNSRLFQATPLRHSRFARLALLQLCKRSPVNLRPGLFVPKGRNHKGTGLFLAAVTKLHGLTGDPRYKRDAETFVGWLRDGVTPGYKGACWGYNFDWQARAFFQPAGTPTVVATTFIANALLDAALAFGWEDCRELASSAADFVLGDLNRTYDGGTWCFSYSPEDRSCVFNASLLGAQLLARVASDGNRPELMDAARAAVRYVVTRQASNGSWAYGELPYHTWIDSFHTGFNLDCLDDYMRLSGDMEVQPALDRGLAYFLANFFLADGTPKYYHNKVHPIDVHAAAQAILTLCRFGKHEAAERVANWTISHMQDPGGFFYYQIMPKYVNRIPYMRWGQAWVYHALVSLEHVLAAPAAERIVTGVD